MDKRRVLFSWVSVATLVGLCAALALLQYRWIGELSRAEHGRLQTGLQISLNRLSHDFNSEITNAVAALLPPTPEPTLDDYASRFVQWRDTGRHSAVFRRVGITTRDERGDFTLHLLDMDRGVFQPAQWPSDWVDLRDGIGRGGPPDRRLFESSTLVIIPRFPRRPQGMDGPPGTQRGPEWMLFDCNLDYLRSELLPEVIRRHLGESGIADFEVEVTAAGQLVFDSDPATRIGRNADATVELFDVQMERLFRRGGPPRGGGRGGRPPGLDGGRWEMAVRHHAGSLDAVVANARWRNLGVAAGLLMLIVATVVALLRFTRQAERLAHLQMQFVAGVSHELRTPLTVIRTAAYNLRGKLATNPVQVEKYGALIQNESQRLEDLVEDVLQFASARAGRVIRDREPVLVEDVLASTVEGTRTVVAQSRAHLELQIDPDLPPVLADPVALKHALQNLISNAAKYGSEGDGWIGVFARRSGDALEIRVSDHGPGIPADEQSRIFDPFYRGKRAIQDQIHGTGLGLSLVKQIVEAHGGSISVRSQPGKGTEFSVRLPAARGEAFDEFAHSIDRG